MSLSKDDILNAIAEMSVMDVHQAQDNDLLFESPNMSAGG